MLPNVLLPGLALVPLDLPIVEDGENERQSVDSIELQGNADSYRPAISRNGRHVAFFSLADDLVPGDTNGKWDVFVRDRLAGTTTRVSVATGGAQGNNDCFNPASSGRGVSLSANGRWVAFHSRAHNLVPVDVNYAWDCFVHDRDPDGNGVFDEGNGTTQLVSVDSAGNQYATSPSEEPWISAQGRFVAFQSKGRLHPGDSNADYDVYVRDRKLGLTYLVSATAFGGAANGDSVHPVLSGNGSYVAYESLASNLVSPDANGVRDVFLTAWSSGQTVRVSEGAGGIEADGPSFCPSISHSGFHVAFSSRATNLSAADVNGAVEDIFAYDLTTFSISPISVALDGDTADDTSLHPSISRSGRHIAFESLATDMTPMQSFHFRDVFVFDRQSGKMTWVSPAWTGSDVYPHLEGRARWPAIDKEGRVVAFESEARNLVAGDDNDAWDVFARVRNRWQPWGAHR